MLVNPTNFTYEHLSSLKFKELQKLSAQFHVNKRWAKKQELIENLLALKNDIQKHDTTNEKQTKDKEWRDGSIVFRDLKPNDNCNDVDKRLTFNIDKKSDTDPIDPRLTFEVSQSRRNLLSKDDHVGQSRQTYEIPPKKSDFREVDPRATFDIPQNGNLPSDGIDPRATFDIPQNEKKLLEENNTDCSKNKRSSGSNSGKRSQKKDLKTESKESNLISSIDLKQESEPTSKNELGKNDKKSQVQVKMLTIPYACVPKRSKKIGESSKSDDSCIKISKKSVNIKKTPRLPAGKIDLIKSPASVKKTLRNQAGLKPLTIPQEGRVFQSKIPIKPQLKNGKPENVGTTAKTSEGDKENLNKMLRRRTSKTADEALMKKPNSVKVSFMTPPPVSKNHRALLPLKKTPMSRKNENKNVSGKLISSITPKTKPIVTATKPITATKMPDFSKIHQKQFEQMDSLHDYIRKKEERVRKLFGTPQPEALNKSTGLFRFEFSGKEKSAVKFGKSTENFSTPLRKRETNVKTAQREAVKNKLPPKCQTDIKDKNRSHIHGVRTNKRFELQMKFRNI